MNIELGAYPDGPFGARRDAKPTPFAQISVDPDKALKYYEEYLNYSGRNAEEKRFLDEKFLVPTYIERLKKEGTTILLVEQNARAALRISDRAYVLETGSIRLQGSAPDLLQNEEVKRAYLGQDSRRG